MSDPMTPSERAVWERLKAAEARERDMARRLKAYEDERAAKEAVAKAILDAKPPKWLIKPPGSQRTGPGVPLLFLSDLHLNEEIDPSAVAYKNTYNPQIAAERLERVFQGTLDIAFSHMVLPREWSYPGIVVALGGDIIDNLAGQFHTAERVYMAMRPSIQHATGLLARGLASLCNHFENVLVICVPGNHGRTTHKMPTRDPSGSNLDAVIYDNLAAHKDLAGKKITFVVAPGVEARFRVFNHAFVLTHGYQWRGGDGEIGPLGPVTRGVKRMRAKYRQMGLAVDTVLVAHFHTYHPAAGLVMNGSLPGYNEYAMQGSFPFEPPVQALMFVHPERGVTCQWPVHAEKKGSSKKAPWASFEKSNP